MPESLTVKALRCAACGTLDPGPRDLCVACQSAELQPAEVPGRGRLASWTTIRRAPTRFRGQAPYIVAVVDLEAGLRITGRIEGEEDRFRLSMPVAAASETDGIVVFREDAA